jgi:hypothetical protein
MSELKGQTTIFDHLKDELDGEPTAARAMKILDQAGELGWTENPFVSLVIRLTRDDAVPFFARWDLSVTDSGKRSWRFQGARAANGQALNFNDIKIYLEDPDVIHPEPPTSPEDDSDEAFRTALGSLDPLGPTAVPPAKNKPEPGFTDWGALLS